MKKKEIKQKAGAIEKALRRASNRLGKFPLNLANPSMFEVEGVSLDRAPLEGVEAGLGRMSELTENLVRELNDMEVLLIQLKHSRGVSSVARKIEEKAARKAKAEAKTQAKAVKSEAKAREKAAKSEAKAREKAVKSEAKAREKAAKSEAKAQVKAAQKAEAKAAPDQASPGQ